MRLRLVPALALVAGLCAADPQRIPLSTVPLERSDGRAYCQLKDGLGSIPFATASGVLLMRSDRSRIRFDSNGDNVIDDADAPAIAGGMFGGRNAPSVEIAIRRGDAAATVRLRVAFSNDDFVMVEPASTLQGVVDSTQVRLIDGDVDGCLGGPGDRIQVGAGEALPWSRLITIGDSLQQIELAPDASALLASAWTGPTTTVRLEMARSFPPRPDLNALGSELTLVHDGGMIAIQLKPGRDTLLIPGRYAIEHDNLTVAPRRQVGNSITLANEGAAMVELTAKPNVLQRGVPSRLSFRAFVDEAGQARVTAVTLEDGFGGRWRAEGGNSTMQLLLRGNGADKQVLKLEYG